MCYSVHMRLTNNRYVANCTDIPYGSALITGTINQFSYDIFLLEFNINEMSHQLYNYFKGTYDQCVCLAGYY